MKNNRLDENIIGSAKVIVDILPKGYGVPNTKITPSSITIHNTDNWDSTAKNNHKYMSNINKSGERKASWHFTVDDIEIYQAQSTNYKMLHAGTTEGNNTSIGIEICQFKDKERQLKAYKNAIELVKILMKYHNFNISKVIQHNKWSGKNCPSVLRSNTYGYSWNWFIEQCKITTIDAKNGWVKFPEGWCYYINYVWQTGWVKDNDKWYFLNDAGYMVTGWVKVNMKWYYLDISGAMLTGWQFINSKWYFLKDNGEMIADTTVKIDINGAMV